MDLLMILFSAAAAESDADLIERLKGRDQQAMADLYDRYGRAAYSLVLRIVRDSATAEDLVQETFLRIWNRVQGFDGRRGALATWILAVARNRAIDYLRSTTGRMARSQFEVDAAEHPSLFVDMERQIVNSDAARRIREALARMNENYRTVIELAYFEGLSQTEMAEKMGQPLGTEKTWVRTALKNLREELTGVTA